MYKRSWNKKYGKSEIFTLKNSHCKNVEVDMVKLADGDIKTYNENDKEGDFVEIPRGYHPFHSAPGYKNYMLWIMAGPVRGFYMTTDEDHAWLNK